MLGLGSAGGHGHAAQPLAHASYIRLQPRDEDRLHPARVSRLGARHVDKGRVRPILLTRESVRRKAGQEVVPGPHQIGGVAPEAEREADGRNSDDDPSIGMFAIGGGTHIGVPCCPKRARRMTRRALVLGTQY